jgi:hypothetical protein
MDARSLPILKGLGIPRGDDTVLYVAAVKRPSANDGNGSTPEVLIDRRPSEKIYLRS